MKSKLTLFVTVLCSLVATVTSAAAPDDGSVLPFPPPDKTIMRGKQPQIFPAIMHFKGTIAGKMAGHDRTIHIP